MKEHRTEAELADPQEEEQTSDLGQVAQNTSRKLLTLLVIGAALLLAIHFTPFGEQVRNWDTLAELFKAGGIKAEVYFVLVSAFLIMVGTPRLLLCGLGGFAFGFWEGLLWSLCGSLIGSFLAFRAARWGGRQWLTDHFGQRRFFGRIVHAKPTVASVVLMRLLPVSNAVINIGLALGRVGNRVFLIGSLVGFLPQGAVAVIVGSGLAEDVPWVGAAQIGIAVVLLLALSFWTSRKRRQRAK
jgi:uncharacterized membrane protein YdjX (TVP38/TMEM64 family)